MNKFLCLSLIAAILFLFPKMAPSQCRATALQTEYLTDPIGIDAAHPRLRWKLDDPRQGARQTAYRILVDTDPAVLAGNKGRIWDSGQVTAEAMPAVYSGSDLQPFTKYYWSVQVWDKDGKSGPFSAPATFETGLMDMANWKGDWITDTRDVDLKPAPYFRRSFAIDKKVKAARVYIAAAGLYELSINGRRIGNHQLDPMYTRFDRRILYVTYDVTEALSKDQNAIGVLLGNGWYNHQSTAVWYFHEAPWRARPKFCLDLRITFEDGSTEVISSGRDWKTATGPLIFNSIYTAEHYDANLDMPGWDQAGFDDSGWKAVMLTPAPAQHIVAQTLHPIRHAEEIPAQSMRTIDDRTYIFNLGRNIAGVSSIKVQGEKGTTLRLRHSELLDKEGNIDLSNIDIHYRPTDDSDPFQTDIFVLSGAGEETFMPRFNYKGFQYVEVTADRPIQLTKESLTGYFMHSDVPPSGSIHSSNPTLNKIWAATNHSYLSNLFGYPTDCPQREKNGWTGDAHIAIETALYNFDGITIYEKWLADHRDEQQANGVLPAIIPTSGWGYHWANGPDWTSTIAIIPWNIYLFYGDSKLLADCYDAIKRYVDHITDISPNRLTDWGLGDWVPVKSKSPVEFTSSLYYYTDVNILAKAAKILGKTADHEQYAGLAKEIAAAFNNKYLNAETGLYGSGLQTELSAALHWGIVPEDLRAKVAAKLAERVIADGKHIDVGLLGTKTILNALSDNGYADLAYEVAAQETFPSWGWWIVNGATTLSENWDLEAGSDISRNHIMFGEIGAWYYKALGGIKADPLEPGFKHILLEPHFIAGLDQFEARHQGPYGEIVSSWKRTNGQVAYTVVVPPDSRATLRLKAGSVTQNGLALGTENQSAGVFTLDLEAGRYELLVD